MARTVEDAVAVFQVIVGEDPDDPVTARSHGRADSRRTRASLVKDGLKDARIGILRAGVRDADDGRRSRQGVHEGDRRHEGRGRRRSSIPSTIERAARPQGDAAPAAGSSTTSTTTSRRADRRRPCTASTRSWRRQVRCRSFPRALQQRLKQSQNATPQGPDSDACKAEAAYREAFGAAVTKAMDAMTLDAFVYPTWSNPPRLIGDLHVAARRQQPAVLADLRLPRHHRADGLHARQPAARGDDVPRPRVGRGDVDQARVRVRTGDEAPASALGRTLVNGATWQ